MKCAIGGHVHERPACDINVQALDRIGMAIEKLPIAFRLEAANKGTRNAFAVALNAAFKSNPFAGGIDSKISSVARVAEELTRFQRMGTPNARPGGSRREFPRA